MKELTNKVSRLSKILLIKCIIFKINIKLKVLMFYNGVKKMSNTAMLSTLLQREYKTYIIFRKEIIALLFKDETETNFTDDEILSRIRVLISISKEDTDDENESKKKWLRWALDNIS